MSLSLMPHSHQEIFLVKSGLTEWKSATENWKTEFYIETALTCVFIVLNLKSTNISLSNFYEENTFKPCLTKQL